MATNSIKSGVTLLNYNARQNFYHKLQATKAPIILQSLFGLGSVIFLMNFHRVQVTVTERISTVSGSKITESK